MHQRPQGPGCVGQAGATASQGWPWRNRASTRRRRIKMTFTIKVALQNHSRRAVACSSRFAGLLAISATLVGIAQADTPSPPTLTEIIVTAQKRQENIQDVPIAVMALSGQELQDAGVKDIK